MDTYTDDYEADPDALANGLDSFDCLADPDYDDAADDLLGDWR